MTTPDLGVCSPWVTNEELGCDIAGVDADLIADAIDSASTILFALSGNQFPGECEDVVRPCARRTEHRRRWRPDVATWTGYWWHPAWAACGCADGLDHCGSCPGLTQVRLRAPLVEVAEVWVDGAELDPTDYRVDDWRWLVRLDGGRFPCCQDMTADRTGDNTFEITYTFGTVPPVAGKRAAASLACELIKAWTPDSEGECRLPERVRTLTRQGVTMTLIDNPRDLFEDGYTGLEEVDLWLGSLRYAAKQRPMTFLSPEVRPRRHRRVGT